jgi:flagellar motor switch protein FliM
MSDDFEEIELPGATLGAIDGTGAFDQAGIDALFGDIGAPPPKKSGLRAMIESNVISHERLPMLEVVYDRMVRTFATSMRNLTSDAIDVSLDDVSSIRFGDFMSHLQLPLMIGVFRIEEWQNYGLISVESGLIYAVVDALLGGRKGSAPLLIDGRGFTTIENHLVSRMLQLALADMSASLAPIAPNTMNLERIETSPRFCAIAGATNICAVATFRVDMEGRGGRFRILLPYATIEPVRNKLAQRFMGEKLGNDNIWETHIASELCKTELSVDVVLAEKMMTLAEVGALAPGDTIRINRGPDDSVALQCGGIQLARAHIGQRSDNIAVRLATNISNGGKP